MLNRFRGLVVVAALILGASVIFVGPAFAKGKSSATLTLTPSPATANSAIQVTGCGYTVGAPTGIEVFAPDATQFAGISVDANGCINTSFYASSAGSYTVQIYQDPHDRWTMAASASLSVQ